MIVKSKDKTRYGKEDFDREEDLLRKRLKEIDRTEKYGQEIPKINKMNDKISLPEIMVHKEKKFLPEPLLGKKYPFFEISNLPQKEDASTQPAFSKQVGKEDASTQPAFSKQVGKEDASTQPAFSKQVRSEEHTSELQSR